MEIANTLEYTYADGVSFCQGLATDGIIFYGIGCYKFLDYNAITKIDIETGEIIKRREMCLPKDLLLKGYSHLGDGCLYEGKLYIALEDFGFRHPGVIVYDPVTLEAVDFHSLPEEQKINTYTDAKRTQNTIYLKLNYDEPSGTVVNVRKSMWIHPVKDRAISIREAARLQTFPDSFVFCGTKDKQYQQVGNAVPPIMAKAIAETLYQVLSDEKKDE